MRVFVTRNIDLEMDLSNGARGTVVDIILNPEEPPFHSQEPTICLQYPPSIVFVKLDKSRRGSMATLDRNVVPIEPIYCTIRIELDTSGQQTVTKTVHQSQLPITAAYACTDYRAQGQTLSSVIVDIATPPSGGLSLFNLYVALSHSRGRDNIRIL